MSGKKIAIEDKNDLTTGVIWKKLLLYFAPIAAGTLFQQLYNAVDAVIVGRFVGTDALAAVGGSPAVLTQLIIGIFVALASGASVIIAQFCGAKEKEKVSLAVKSSIYFCVIIGVVLSIIMLFLAKPLLLLLNTPEETLADAMSYVKIYFAGSMFILVYDMGSGILRAAGDSRKPFIYLIAGCISNIVLDLVFVIVFKMGVPGVAWATTISQGISFALVVIELLKTNEYYKLKLRPFTINLIVLKRMMSIGVPSAVQSAMYGISNLILQVAVNGLGTVVVASWALSGKLDGIYWAVSTAFDTAIMNFVAQNFGAGKLDRIKQSSKTGYLIYLASTVVLSSGLLLLAKPLLLIFTEDQAVRDTTWQIMTYFVPFYVVWTSLATVSAILRGMSDAIKPTIIMALGVCVLRIVWVVTVFLANPTLPIVCISYPLSWVVTGIAMVLYYRKRSKKIYAGM